MAEYIDREAAISLIKQYGHNEIDGGRYSLDTVDDCIELVNRIEALPMEDVAPVVRCKDCEYSYDEISYLCCSHGVCVDCEVPPNFSCAYGKRRAENEPPEEGET